jgi:hypothetical protein
VDRGEAALVLAVVGETAAAASAASASAAASTATSDGGGEQAGGDPVARVGGRGLEVAQAQVWLVARGVARQVGGGQAGPGRPVDAHRLQPGAVQAQRHRQTCARSSRLER